MKGKKRIKSKGRILFLISCIFLICAILGTIYYLFFSTINYKIYENIDYNDCYLKVKAGERKIICNIATSYEKGYKIEIGEDDFTVYLNNKEVLSGDISSIEYYEMPLNNNVLAFDSIKDYYIIFGKAEILIVDNKGNILDKKENVYPTLYLDLDKKYNSTLKDAIGTDEDGIYIFTYVDNEKNKDRLYNYYSCYFDVLVDVYKYDTSKEKLVLVKENLNGSSIGCIS